MIIIALRRLRTWSKLMPSSIIGPVTFDPLVICAERTGPRNIRVNVLICHDAVKRYLHRLVVRVVAGVGCSVELNLVKLRSSRNRIPGGLSADDRVSAEF